MKQTLLLIFVLIITACSAAASSAPSPPEELSLTTTSIPSLIAVAPDEPSPCPSPTLNKTPSPSFVFGPTSSVLLAVEQHARTAIVALDALEAVPFTEPQIIDKIQLSAAGDVLAYQALDGINPLHNVIVTANLSTGVAWHIVPGDGCAVFGFVLDPIGERLALLQVAMRGQFKPAAWRISVMELASGHVDTLTPSWPDKVALEPVAWSNATDEIILHAFIPFQAAGLAGLWTVSAHGSHLRQLLPESDYVGQPRLSPDGRLLAYFASAPANLPVEYLIGPGEPPANALHVLNLVTGKTQMLTTDTARVFGTLAWDATGERLYLSQGAWRDTEHAFWFDEIVSLPVNHPTPIMIIRTSENVVDLKPCAEGGPVYVTAQGQGVIARRDKQDIEWMLENGTVEILACR